MTVRRVKLGEQWIELVEIPTFQIPPEWVTLMGRLHPITAVVVWAVLNNQLTEEIMQLARYSPDVRRYEMMGIVAGGNSEDLPDVTRLAYDQLLEVYADVFNDPRENRML